MATPLGPVRPLNDLSGKYGLTNGTVYRKSDNFGFSTPQQFFADSGVNSFDNLKFDTAYTPQARPQEIQPVQQTPQPQVQPQVQQFQQPTVNRPLPDMNPVNTALAEYQKTIAPSAEEQQAQQNLHALQASVTQGLYNVEGKPIAQEFQTGQKAAIMRNAAYQTAPLQAQLASLQARRQAAQDVAKTGYDAAQKNYDNQLNLYKASAPDNLLTKVDDATGSVSVVSRNPLTGELSNQVAGNTKATRQFYKYENDPTVYRRDGKAYSSAEQFVADGGSPDFSNVQVIKPESKLTEVNPGNSLVDQTGKVLYQAPYKPTVGDTKNKPVNNAVKKYIPGNVSQQDFDFVYDALTKFAQANRVNAMSTEEKYKAWGEAAQDLKASGYNPTDFDALLWQFFHPEGLAGFEKRAKDKANTKDEANEDNPFT